MSTFFLPVKKKKRECQIGGDCRRALHVLSRKDKITLLQSGIVVDNNFLICNKCHEQSGIAKIQKR